MRSVSRSHFCLNHPYGMQRLELEVNIPNSMFEEIASFKLLRNNQCIVYLEFWFCLKNKREINKFKRRNSKIYGSELELLTLHPTAIIYNSLDVKYEHIILAIINGLLIALSKTF